MANLTSGVKRLLVGRALRSDKLSETLLPKRIALPVFASDATTWWATKGCHCDARLSTAEAIETATVIT